MVEAIPTVVMWTVFSLLGILTTLFLIYVITRLVSSAVFKSLETFLKTIKFNRKE